MNEPKTIRVIFRRDGDVVLVRSDVLDGGDPGTIKVTTVRMRRGDTLKGSLNGRNGDHHILMTLNGTYLIREADVDIRQDE